MKIESVDERDARWAREDHVFRVFLFRPNPQGSGFGSEVFDVTDAELGDVYAWARRKATPDRLFSIALVQGDGSARGLLWLYGMDANSHPVTEAQHRALHAMHERSSPGVV